MDLLGRLLVGGFAGPAALSLALTLLGRRLERPWLVALALPLAYGLGCLSAGAAPRVPPLDAVDWLYFLAPFGPALAASREGQPPPSSALGLFWCGLASALLAGAALGARQSPAQIAGVAAMIALLVVAATSSMQAGLDGQAPRRVWAAAWALALMLTVALGLTGSVRLAGLAATLVAAAAPLPLLAGPWRGLDAAAPAFCLIFVGLAFCGAALSSTPPLAALALCVGLVSAGQPRSGLLFALLLGGGGLALAARAGLH